MQFICGWGKHFSKQVGQNIRWPPISSSEKFVLEITKTNCANVMATVTKHEKEK